MKRWKQLKTKKGREATRLFLAEGIRLVDEALSSPYEVEAILWNVGTDELPAQIRNHPKCQHVFFELSPGAFAELSDTVTSQGVIAIVEMPILQPLAKELDRAVLLDGVQDPGNVGTLIRSCDAFGFARVCCGTHTADAYSPKAVRASMGGLFRVSAIAEASAEFVMRWRETHPSGAVVVAQANATQTCSQVDLRGPLLLVVGGEAFGVSESVQARATHHIAIPMSGQTESLNAAIAGSVLMYESQRQRIEHSYES